MPTHENLENLENLGAGSPLTPEQLDAQIVSAYAVPAAIVTAEPSALPKIPLLEYVRELIALGFFGCVLKDVRP